MTITFHLCQTFNNIISQHYCNTVFGLNSTCNFPTLFTSLKPTTLSSPLSISDFRFSSLPVFVVMFSCSTSQYWNSIPCWFFLKQSSSGDLNVILVYLWNTILHQEEPSFLKFIQEKYELSSESLYLKLSGNYPKISHNDYCELYLCWYVLFATIFNNSCFLCFVDAMLIILTQVYYYLKRKSLSGQGLT